MTQIFTVCNCFAIKNRQKISKNMNSFKPAEKVTLEFQSPFITCLPSSFWEERGIMLTMDPWLLRRLWTEPNTDAARRQGTLPSFWCRSSSKQILALYLDSLSTDENIIVLLNLR